MVHSIPPLATDEDADILDRLFMQDLVDASKPVEHDRDIFHVKTKLQDKLPRNVLPQNYLIRLQVFMDEPQEVDKRFRADGFVAILIKCEKPTDSIVLHADQTNAMNIISSAVRLVSNF